MACRIAGISSSLPLARIGLALVVSFLAGSSLWAAPVTFAKPVAIAGDTDVLTNGKLVCAFNLGGGAQTVNTVAFAAGTAGNTMPLADLGTMSIATGVDPDGRVIVADAPTFVGDGDPYNSLSPAYKNLLGSADYNNSSKGTFVVTFSGLKTGTAYVAQFFINDSRGTGRVLTIASGGATSDPIALNVMHAAGGLGQWISATFTADGPTQEFVLAPVDPTTDDAQLNAVQLRDTSSL